MKRPTTFLAILAAGLLPAGAQLTETVTFSGLNKPIPDGSFSGLSDRRTVTSAVTSLSSVKVRLQMAGEYNGDLYVYLRHARNGVTNLVVLLNRVGRDAASPSGYPDSGMDVVLDDAASRGDIHVYRAVTNLAPNTALSGTWQPDGRKTGPLTVVSTSPRNTSLAMFQNMDASGEWALFAADVQAGGTNMLLGWQLILTGTSQATVTWAAPADITYGTALGASQLNASATVPGTFAYTPAAGAVLNAGASQTLSVRFTPTDGGSYAPVTKTVSLKVLPKALTITAGSGTKIYGAPLPGFGVSYSGFVNGDNAGKLTSLPVAGTTATASSPVGNYPVTASGAAASNYAISYVAGTLSITKASLTGALASSRNPSTPGQSVSFTASLGAVAPGAGLPTGAVQFRVDGQLAGSASLSSGAAAFTTSALTHGNHVIVSEYSGDGNFTGVTNQLASLQLVNTMPVAGANTAWRSNTNSVKIEVAALLEDDTDADGDTLSFLGASATSANGGTITSQNGWLFYNPPAGYTGADTFTYTISDGYAPPVTGIVTVSIRVDNTPSPNLSIATLPGGSCVILGDGIPGFVYRIQYADNAAHDNWKELGTASVTDDGFFSYTDNSGAPQRFYRSVYP